MACCPKGIFSPLITNCAGETEPMPVGGFLRGGDLIMGADIMLVTSDTTLYTNAIVIVDATGGAVTIALPPANIGAQFIVKKIDVSANTVTLDGDGSETIDGVTTKVISSQNDTIDIISDGTEWWII